MSIEEKIAGIHDPDLRAEVEAARGGFLFAQIVEHVLHRQRERDAQAALLDEEETRRAGLSRDQRRRDAVRLVIESEPALPSSLQHIHSVLALCGLPYRDPGPVREFSRTYGRNSLSLIAGRIKDPETGAFEPQGLPYGPKARLVLLHLCTEAVRQRSPTVKVAETLSGFMREMGFAVTGGERGTIRQFKEQLNRLAACSMQIGLWDGRDSATTLNVPPFRSLELWRPRAGEGDAEAGRTVRFDPEFYETLIRHALPVDIRAARAFSGSARKLDLLFWTGYRLRVAPAPPAADLDQPPRAVRGRERLDPQLPAGVQGGSGASARGLPAPAPGARRRRPDPASGRPEPAAGAAAAGREGKPGAGPKE